MDTGCFSILAIVKIGALNLGGGNTFKWVFSLYSNKYPQDELLGHTLVFFLLITYILFYILVALIYNSQGFTFLHIFARNCYFLRWVLTDFDLHFPNSLVKAMVFPVVMYRCESWTIKKAEHQRIDAFELWCWRRLLRVPWCWGPEWGTPPMAKVMRKEAQHTQRRDRASGVPLEILERLPP